MHDQHHTSLRFQDLCASSPNSPITLEDLWPLKKFHDNRSSILPLIIEEKKKRRMKIGPWATVLFENKTLLWWQVQEMLRLEKGGEAQALDELMAYNPLIPAKGEIVFTLMLEFLPTTTRPQKLSDLVNIEKKIFLRGEDGFVLHAHSIDEHDISMHHHKASTVNFLKFRKEKNMMMPKVSPFFSIEHHHYEHTEQIPQDLWDTLSGE